MASLDDYSERFSFQDFIGYFIPGALTTAAVAVLLRLPDSFTSQLTRLGTGVTVVLMLAVSYSMGILVAATTRPLENVLWARVIRKRAGLPQEFWDALVNRAWSKIGLAESAQTSTERRDRIALRVAREVLRESSPRFGAQHSRIFGLGMHACPKLDSPVNTVGISQSRFGLRNWHGMPDRQSVGIDRVSSFADHTLVLLGRSCRKTCNSRFSRPGATSGSKGR